MSFTDVATVKTLLGIPVADTSQDARLTILVDSVNAEMLGFFNLTSCSPTAYTNKYDFDFDTSDVWLREYPVITVDTVSFNGTVQAASTYYLSNPKKFGLLSLENSSGIVYPYVQVSGFPHGRQTIEVTHTAGWAGGTPPADLQGAAGLLAIARYNMDRKTGFSGEKIGQYSYDLGGGGAGSGVVGAIGLDGMPIGTRRVLSQHLRILATDN